MKVVSKFIQLSTRIILIFLIFNLTLLNACRSKKYKVRQKPCDCPEFDNKPPKHKKRTSFNWLEFRNDYRLEKNLRNGTT